MLNEHIVQLLNEDCIYTKRVVEIFNVEYDLDNFTDLEQLINLLEKQEESLKYVRTILLKNTYERTLVRCFECNHLHQEEQNKDLFFCLKAREYIEHEIDDTIGCKVFQKLQIGKDG